MQMCTHTNAEHKKGVTTPMQTASKIARRVRIRFLLVDIPTCFIGMLISLKRTRFTNEDIGYRMRGQHFARMRTLLGVSPMHNKARHDGLEFLPPT